MSEYYDHSVASAAIKFKAMSNHNSVVVKGAFQTPDFYQDRYPCFIDFSGHRLIRNRYLL